MFLSVLQIIAQNNISVEISERNTSGSVKYLGLKITNNNNASMLISGLAETHNGNAIGLTESNYQVRLLNPQTNELIQESRKLSLRQESITRSFIGLRSGESYETFVTFNTNRWHTGLFDGVYGVFLIEMTVNLRYIYDSNPVETFERSFTSNLLLFDNRR